MTRSVFKHLANSAVDALKSAVASIEQQIDAALAKEVPLSAKTSDDPVPFEVGNVAASSPSGESSKPSGEDTLGDLPDLGSKSSRRHRRRSRRMSGEYMALKLAEMSSVLEEASSSHLAVQSAARTIVPNQSILPDAGKVGKYVHKMDGLFLNGRAEGRGVYKEMLDGEIVLQYEGDFHAGRRHGKGEQTDAYGKKSSKHQKEKQNSN